jgi:hypothetical protein
MLAVSRGARVVCIELHEEYHRWQVQCLDLLSKVIKDAKDKVMLIQGNCLDYLPFPATHIITSPPYADALGEVLKLNLPRPFWVSMLRLAGLKPTNPVRLV